jgi:hypothetical protein
VGADLIEAHSLGYGGPPELVAHPAWVNTNPIDMAASAILNVKMPNVVHERPT